MTKQIRNTWLFIGLLLLSGIANLFTRTAVPELDTLMTCVNYLTYIGLLLFWIEAVRIRLLPSAARTSILSAAFLMLLYMLLRVFKYRFAVSVIALRYAVYAYWIPQMLIPTLFLMTCIRIRRGGQEKEKRNENLLLIPAGILAFMAMTNDIHSLVYVPRIHLSEFILTTGSYRYGLGFYLMYAWMIGGAVSGLMLLYHAYGQMPKKVIQLITLIVVLWTGLIMLNLLVLDRLPDGYHMYYNPEIRDAYGEIEENAKNKLLSYLPDDLKDEYSDLFVPTEGEKELWQLVKAADKISALIKCLDERNMGNNDFVKAESSTLASIKKLGCAEADEFLEEFLPAYGLTLDEQA